MINLYDEIEKFKAANPELWQALFKFADTIQEHERRIKLLEDELDRVQNYTSFCLLTAFNAQLLANVPGWTNLVFDIDYFDQDNLHDPATNNDQVRIKNSGFYLLVGCCWLDHTVASSDIRGLRFLLSASSQDLAIHGTHGAYQGHVACGFRHIRAETTVVLQAFTTSGAQTNITANDKRPLFAVYRLPFDSESNLSGVPF